nr:ribonuclease H-like domain-containing protein [Tanacetum cinerariifolium]
MEIYPFSSSCGGGGFRHDRSGEKNRHTILWCYGGIPYPCDGHPLKQSGSGCSFCLNSWILTLGVELASTGLIAEDDGKCIRARFVATGSTQVEVVDVDEMFSLVVKPGTIRTVLSLAISRHWPVYQLDVKNAFFHGDLAETVYMHQPPSFRDPEHPNYIIASLHREFSMTDLGALNYFLGISVTRDSSGMFLSQRKYAMEILERAHMVGCNPSRTPVDTESKLGDGGTPVIDPTLYQSLAGSFQYLTFTRPDITYAVQQTLDYGLQLFSLTTNSLISYSVVDWAGCPTTLWSTSGYCVFLGNNLLSWSSKRQPTLSRSRAEAEYRGIANAVVRVLHVPSRFQYADIFTKGLPSALFDEFRDSLSVRCTPAPTAGSIRELMNIWHGLSALVPFVAWHLKEGCALPSRWILYHWGEVRTGMSTWLDTLMEATFDGPLNIEKFDDGRDMESIVCYEESVVMRHNEGGMSREKRMGVYDLI